MAGRIGPSQGKSKRAAARFAAAFAALLAATAGSRPAHADDLAVAMSRGANGVDIGGDSSYADAVSADGRGAAITSDADDLVAGQVASADPQLFFYDRISRFTTLISHAAGLPATPADAQSFDPRMSADGRFVAYESEASNLVAGVSDPNFGFDIYLWERATGASTLVSFSSASPLQTSNSGSSLLGISADGRYVLYTSSSTDLPGVLADSNGNSDVLLFDRLGATRLVSHTAGAAETTTANGASSQAVLSADGGWVALNSDATDLVSGVTDGNGLRDAFLWERAAAPAAAFRLVSRSKTSATTTQNGDCNRPAIAPDGSWVGFRCDGSDVAGTTSDTNANGDLFQYDRAGNVVRLVSYAAGSATVTAGAESGAGASSASGEYVAFPSYATNLVAGQGDAAGTEDLFLWTRSGGAIALVHHAAGSTTQVANNELEGDPRISDDGGIVVYSSRATNLIAGITDGNATADVFRWQRSGNVTSLVSHLPGLPLVTGGNDSSSAPQISADGALIAFSSGADDLVAGDSNEVFDAFYVYPREVFAGGFERGTTAGWSNVSP